MDQIRWATDGLVVAAVVLLTASRAFGLTVTPSSVTLSPSSVIQITCADTAHELSYMTSLEATSTSGSPCDRGDGLADVSEIESWLQNWAECGPHCGGGAAPQDFVVYVFEVERDAGCQNEPLQGCLAGAWLDYAVISVHIDAPVAGAPDRWIKTSLSVGPIGNVVVSPSFAADHTMFALSVGVVYRTRDAGATWELTSAGLHGSAQSYGGGNSIALSPNFQNDRTVFVGTSDGLFRSVDAGDSWQLLPTMHGTSDSYVALSPDFPIDGTLFYGGVVIVKSTDRGQTWTNVLDLGPLFDGNARLTAPVAFAPDFRSSGHVFAVVGNWSGPAQLLASSDRGSTWQRSTIPGPDGIDPPSLAIAGGHGAYTIFVGTDNVLRSTDGGATFSGATGVHPNDIRSILTSPAYAIDRVVFATGGGSTYDPTGAMNGPAVHVSSDGGISFESMYDGLHVGDEHCILHSMALTRSFVTDRTLVGSSAASDLCGGVWVRTITGPGVPVVGGSGVTVELGNAASLVFEHATDGSATVSTSPNPPSHQSAFEVSGFFYHISTTATFSGMVQVTLPYDASLVSDPQALRLFHFDSRTSTWWDVTTSVDTLAHTVTGLVSHLSPFAVGTLKRSFLGFEPPMRSDGGSIFKIGRTIPLKFRVGTEQDGSTLDARLYVSKIGDGISGIEQMPESTDAPDQGNLFRVDGNHYSFNLGTRTLSPGTWLLRVELTTGLSYAVRISLAP